MTDEVTDVDFREALARIAGTEDGYLLYLYMQRTLCGTIPGDGANERAFPIFEGRRRFASELMGLMAEGIRNSGRSTVRPVVFALARAARVAGGGSDGATRFRPEPTGRRVGPSTFVSGWDSPNTEPLPGESIGDA